MSSDPYTIFTAMKRAKSYGEWRQLKNEFDRFSIDQKNLAKDQYFDKHPQERVVRIKRFQIQEGL